MSSLKYAAAAIFFWCALSSPSPSRACDAATVFAQMRAVTGGSRWHGVREITAWGSAATSGLDGSARFDDDLGRGRYAQHFRIAVEGGSATVYDGSTLWSQDISGGVHPMDSAFPRARAVTEAYLARREYFEDPSSAAFACREMQARDGGRITVVRVTPRWGIPADLSIDAKTHLLASISETLPLTVQTTRYADYREVDGLRLPYSIAFGTTLDPADDVRVRVARYRLRTRATNTDFARPVPINDGIILGRRSWTTVPITLEAGELIVWASIDGHPSLPFILDTGGHAILTTLAARTLGLRGSGAGQTDGSGPRAVAVQYTQVGRVRIGDAELRNQHFLIVPYGYSFYERGRKTPLAGLIGLEFYERFATRIDYAARRLTITPLATFRYHAGAKPVRFHFQDDMPMIQAAADGHRALFGTDTGNSGSVILFGHFLGRTDLSARYTHGFTIFGHGTGGTNTGRLETLHRFTIAGHHLHDVSTVFTNMRSGAFSSWTEGGNVGYAVLSRFIPTYDYATETLYLEPSPHAPPLPKNRSGLAIVKNTPDAFVVTSVRPGSAAAAAGIAAGDRIVRVNGKEAADFSRADFAGIVSRPAGTYLQLHVQRAGTTRQVALVLRP